MSLKQLHNIIVLFIISMIVYSCSPKYYKYTKEAINNQKNIMEQCDCFTYINEIDSNVQKKLNTINKKLIQIYLIRHAKPNISKKTFYTSKQAQEYVTNYNKVSINTFDSTLICNTLYKPHTIYCSDLRRAVETAESIFKYQYNIVSDSIFREYENKIIKAPNFIRAPLIQWQIISRLSWLLGKNDKDIESYKEAKIRAAKAGCILNDIATKEETAILVAHGMLNRAIAKKLKKDDWVIIEKNGHKNLGATVLVKEIDLTHICINKSNTYMDLE